MRLTGAQLSHLHRALCSAFPSRDALERMVRFGLDENLNAIGGGGSLNDTVFDLIQWAEAQGRLEELLARAREANAGNPELRAFEASLGPTPPPPSGSGGGPAAVPPVRPASPPSAVAGAGPAPRSEPAAGPVALFYSYSHRDTKLRDRLQTHLALLKRDDVIREWHDRKITAGSEWAGEIDAHLNEAQIILLLVSADFLASDYCYDLEMKRALERHDAGEARVIPVILRDVDWSSAPFRKLQALPTDGKPVTGRGWKSQDEAFTNVARGIRQAVRELTGG